MRWSPAAASLSVVLHRRGCCRPLFLDRRRGVGRAVFHGLKGVLRWLLSSLLVTVLALRSRAYRELSRRYAVAASGPEEGAIAEGAGA